MTPVCGQSEAATVAAGYPPPALTPDCKDGLTRAMADYYPLLARAVAGLAPEAKEQRRSIYERARKALLGQLRGIDPPVPDDDVQRESEALDEAIARLERELAIAQPVPPPPVAAPGPTADPPAPRPVSQPPRRDPIPRPERPQAPFVSAPFVSPPFVPPSLVAPDASAPKTDLEHDAELAALASTAPPVALPQADAPLGTSEAPAVAVRMRTADNAPRLDVSRDGEPPRSEAARPAAPRPEQKSGGARRLAMILAAVAVLFGGVGYAAWKMRDRPEDIVRSRSPIVETQQQPAAGPKVNERIGSGAAPTRPSDLQPPERAQPAQPTTPAQQPPSQPTDTPGIAVGQRVGLLLQSDAPQGFDTQMGNVVWRMDSINRGPGVPLSRAIRADFDVPDAKLKGFITIEKNLDPTLRASHTVTVRFLPSPDSALAKITEIGLPVMRSEASANVEPLAGVQAKITDNIFIVALTSDPQFAVRNIETIKSRGWFDIPMKLADGRAAKITLEKGTPGDRIVNEAFEAWSR